MELASPEQRVKTQKGGCPLAGFVDLFFNCVELRMAKEIVKFLLYDF